MLRLAGPVVLAEVGWMAMGTVDTVMLGHVGREALAGGATGEALFHFAGLFGMGLLLGLDTLIAQAFGAGDIEDCNHSVRQGVLLSLFLTAPLMIIVSLSPPFMRLCQVTEPVYVNALAYVEVVNWSMLPLLLYAAFRRYLQAFNVVRPVTFALVSANVVNAFFNWVLIYGNLGAPRLGTAGAAWATVAARGYMAAVLIAYTAYRQLRNRSGPFHGRWTPDWQRIRELLRLGFPAAAQMGLEVGVFGLATVLAGTLSTVAAAAHQVALNTAAITFMVPLGISSAGAVRVGHAIGAGNSAGARRSGWTALLLGCAFMSLAGIVLFTVPRAIIHAYTADPAVIAAGVWLLIAAAFFQLFDGLQVVATGILRGIGDTRTPMFANLIGHWFIGLPLGYVLCFYTELGIVGLWVGLSVGLTLVAIALLAAWHRRTTPLYR